MTPAAAAALVAAVSAVLYGGVYAIERRIAFAPPSMSAIALFVAGTVALYVCYLRLLRLAREVAAASSSTEPSGTNGRVAARTILMGTPVAIWLALACAPPVLSMDVFSYLAHGAQLDAGTNPYAERTLAVGEDAYGQALRPWGWLPVHDESPYGPLWTRLEGWSHRQSLSIYGQMLWLKLPLVLCGLLSTVFIGLILRTTAPEYELPGVVAFAWNPLVVFEVAIGGHNDAMMLAFCLAGLACFVRQRTSLGTFGICAAALVKLNALMVTPPLLVHIVRAGSRRIMGAAAAVVIAALVGWLLYGSLWIGQATFAGLHLHAVPNITPSTGGTLFYYLTRTHGEAASARAVSFALNSALLLVAGVLSWRARTMRRSIAACAWISVAVLVLSSSYWPWYAVLPVALCALTPDDAGVGVAALTFSFFGRLAAPLDRLRLNGLMDWPTEAVVTTIIGIWVPAALVLAYVAVARASRGEWPSMAHRGSSAGYGAVADSTLK